MSASRRAFRTLASIAAAAGLFAGQAAEAQRTRTAMDPDNPTCPLNPNWSANRQMTFTVQNVNGRDVLLAEGAIDDDLLPRLQTALRNFHGDEIWLRSPGGNARVGNQAGRLIRDNNMTTRIPAGWACFSACNFLFMGGGVRYVDPGGLFIVHMFTYTGNREAIRSGVAGGEAGTADLIGEVEQDSAMLASEDNAFLLRMGVHRELLTDIMYRQRAVQGGQERPHHRCLTQEEVNRYFVATVPWSGPAPPTQKRGTAVDIYLK